MRKLQNYADLIQVRTKRNRNALLSMQKNDNILNLVISKNYTI